MGIYIDPVMCALTPLASSLSRQPGGDVCLMDVSGSMGRNAKGPGQALFVLLHLFSAAL